MRFRNFVFATVLFTASVFGQTDRAISLGVKGGIPMTDAFYSAESASGACGRSVSFVVCSETGYSFKMKRWLLGPFAEIHVGRHFTIEADALYHRLNYDTLLVSETPSSGLHYSFSSTAADDWEFPLLVKFRLSGSRSRPFVVGGIAIDHISGIHQATDSGYRDFSFSGVTHMVSSHSSELNDSTAVGFATGLGVELRVSRLRISPEIRYLRWATENFRGGLYQGTEVLFHSSRNQAQFLLGISF